MRKVKLGDVCVFQFGFPFDSVKFSVNKGMPLIRIRDIVRGFTETFTEEKCGKEYIVRKNDLLIGMDGEFNIGRWKSRPAVLNQRVCKLIPKEDIDADYLYYFMPKALKEIENRTPFVTVKHLSAKQLNAIEIMLPSIEEQKAIAEKLDKVSSLIEKRKQQLSLLDTLVKSKFVEMFGPFPDNPKRWEVGTIRDIVADVRYGSSRPAVKGGKYKYLRMNNITYDGELDLSEIKYIDIPDSELSKCTVRRGDVLFNRTNSKELVGKTCVYDQDEMMVLAGFVIRIRVNDRVLPEFLAAFLNTKRSKKMLLGMCKAAIGQANINAQEMQNINLYIPPIEYQDRFLQLKKYLDSSKAKIKKSLAALELLKKSLMQKYFG